MSDPPSATIIEILRESAESYEQALKSGIKLREDTVNLWKGMLRKLGSAEEFQSKLEEITAGLFPAARKQMEEAVETLNRTSGQALSLYENTAALCNASTLSEVQRRLQEVAESYFDVAHSNLKIAFDANARAIGNWRDLAGRLVPA